MPLIVKEGKLIENLDESSKKCLKNLNETLSPENQPPNNDGLNSLADGLNPLKMK